MGVLVHDSVNIDSFNIAINEFTITCKGSYQISKETINETAIYHIRTTLYWYLSGGLMPIQTEHLAFSYNGDLPADIFSEIYNRVKARYTTTTDI